MQISDAIRDQIASNMELKTTEELKTILDQNDREEWTDAAFEVVKEILLKRTGEIPQTPIQQEDPITESWIAVNWEQVYTAIRKETTNRGGYNTGLILLFMLFVIFVVYRIQSPLKGNIIFVLILTGCLAYGAMRYFNQRRFKKLLVLKARVYHKKENDFRRNNQHPVEIVILKAGILTSNGDVLKTTEWKGHRKVIVPGEMFYKFEEQDTLDLLCLPNGLVLGELDEYVGR